jgi:PadR family transcriptional regulator, regulatory protein PadR
MARPVTKHSSLLTRPLIFITLLDKCRDQTLWVSFEQLVLTAILTLRDDAYGVTIHGKVEELADPKPASLGAVYVTLDRLEDKGLVGSWLSEPTAERGGRAKRCYRLEALGEQALQESAVTAKRIWDGIEEVWGKDWAKE